MTTAFKTTAVIPDAVKNSFRLYGLDGLLTAGSQYIFDPLDPNSWSKQTTPISGDTLANLVSGGATASFNASPPAYASGGFVMPGGSSSASVRFPTTGKVAAGASKLLSIYWLYHGTQGVTTGSHFVAGIGGTSANMQHGIYMSGNGSNGTIQLVGNGQLIAGIAAPTAQMMQIAIGIELIGGVYVLTAFKNGVLQGTFTQGAGVTTIVQPGQTNACFGAYTLVGGDSLSSGTWIGRFHRAVFDTLSGGESISAQVTLDYELNATRMGL